MTVYELASVADVTEVKAGSELSTDFVATNTLLTLYTTLDFSDEGGQVTIDGDVYDYDTKDEEANTITLANGLLRDMPADTRVWLYPEALTKMAIVEIDEEVDEARVPHNLVGSVEAMVRDGFDQESVLLEQQGSGWVIKDIFAEQYKTLPETIDPSTLPMPVVPPATVSPVFTVTPGPAAIIVEWDYVPQAIDIYLAFADTAPIDSTTLYDTNIVSPYWIYKDQNGNPILPTSTPFIALQAAGAPPTAWVAAQTGVIPDGFMTVLAGTVIATRLAGQEVSGAVLRGGELDIAGAIHALPGFLDITANQLNALAATFSDNVTILGQNNKLAGGMELGSGVSNPTSKVTVTSAEWTSLSFPSAINAAVWGFTNNPANTEHWAVTDGLSGTNCYLYRIDKATGAVLGTQTLAGMPKASCTPFGGCTRIGNELFVLVEDANRASEMWVYVYDVTTWAKLREWKCFGTQANLSHIGVYNGEIIVAWMNSSFNLRWRTYTAATGAQTRDITGAGVFDMRRDVWSVDQYGSGNIGVWVDGYNPGGYNISNTARDTTLDFSLPAGATFRGLYYDGQRPHVLLVDKVMSGGRHPGGTFEYGWTQVDSDLGGGGVAETMLSPLLADSSVGRFKRPVVTIPAPADDGTTDGANTGAIYARPSGAATFRRQNGGGANLNVNNAGAAVGGELVEPNKKLTLDWVDTTATLPAPPTSNGFSLRASSAPGYIWSSKTDAAGQRLIDLPGDGINPRIRNLRTTRPFIIRHRSTDQSLASAVFERLNFNQLDIGDPTGTLAATNSGGTYTVSRAGRYRVHAQIAWAAGTTGRRIVQIRVNGVAVARRAIGATAINGSSDSGLDITRDVVLAVNDNVEIWAWQNQGVALAALGELGAAPVEHVTFIDMSYEGDAA